uniref:Uncharacterized protein n=1 Tax=viral metagenome TaxID=1070528 RepID=A0A6C0IWX3_9ZZZZ
MWTRTAPLSGSELPYDGESWNKMGNVQKLNCYDYAWGNANPHQLEFSQPIPRPPNELYTCNNVEKGMMKQHPDAEIIEFEQSCPSGKRKVALVVDDVAPSDYHWYRQDNDGFWSHKQGYMNPTNLDASGDVIKDPRKSDRKFEHFNYTKMCNFYCIPGATPQNS